MSTMETVAVVDVAPIAVDINILNFKIFHAILDLYVSIRKASR